MVHGGVGWRRGGVLCRSIAAFSLMELHSQLFNLSLLLVQLPRQLLNHLLLFHQHLIFFSIHAIHTSTIPHPRSSPSQAVLHAELSWRWLQGELSWRGHRHVTKAVR